MVSIKGKMTGNSQLLRGILKPDENQKSNASKKLNKDFSINTCFFKLLRTIEGNHLNSSLLFLQNTVIKIPLPKDNNKYLFYTFPL